MTDDSTTVGPYRLFEILGAGGFGRVYRAEHTLLKREVALKVLHAHAEAVRFIREAQILAQLNHPNIVQVYDCGESEDGTCYIALEILRGENLLEVIRRGALKAAETTWIIRQVLEGLAHAHESGVVHRDVKPSNILLVPNETGGLTVKLLDFGVSLLTDRTRITGTNGLVGTPRYIAPELLHGMDSDARSDLWAVGISWVECLRGVPAYAGDAAKVLPQILDGPPVLPDGRHVGPQIHSILRQLLAPRDVRFAHARAVLGALDSSVQTPIEPIRLAAQTLHGETLGSPPATDPFAAGLDQTVTQRPPSRAAPVPVPLKPHASADPFAPTPLAPPQQSSWSPPAPPTTSRPESVVPYAPAPAPTGRLTWTQVAIAFLGALIVLGIAGGALYLSSETAPPVVGSPLAPALAPSTTTHSGQFVHCTIETLGEAPSIVRFAESFEQAVRECECAGAISGGAETLNAQFIGLGDSTVAAVQSSSRDPAGCVSARLASPPFARDRGELDSGLTVRCAAERVVCPEPPPVALAATPMQRSRQGSMRATSDARTEQRSHRSESPTVAVADTNEDHRGDSVLRHPGAGASSGSVDQTHCYGSGRMPAAEIHSWRNAVDQTLRSLPCPVNADNLRVQIRVSSGGQNHAEYGVGVEGFWSALQARGAPSLSGPAVVCRSPRSWCH